MVVTLNGIMVFKEVNVSPLKYTDMQAQYKGIGDDPLADAKINSIIRFLSYNNIQVSSLMPE